MAIVRAYNYNITTNDIENGAVTEPKIDLSSENSTNLVLATTGTDTDKPPEITFERKSTTVADDMDIGKLSFRGQNSSPEDVEYAQILVQASDVTDTDEGGEFIISAQAGGRLGTSSLTECLAIGIEDAGGGQRAFALQINRTNATDLDFIVRGDNNNNLIRTRCENDQVGLGGAPDAAMGAVFQVTTTTSSSIPAPKMTTTQRNALSNIAAGCMIYNITTNKLQCHNGTGWQDCF
jgi:hypothetical protein